MIYNFDNLKFIINLRSEQPYQISRQKTITKQSSTPYSGYCFSSRENCPINLEYEVPVKIAENTSLLDASLSLSALLKI